MYLLQSENTFFLEQIDLRDNNLGSRLLLFSSLSLDSGGIITPYLAVHYRQIAFLHRLIYSKEIICLIVASSGLSKAVILISRSLEPICQAFNVILVPFVKTFCDIVTKVAFYCLSLKKV